MRIQHNHLLAKVLAHRKNRADLIRISRNYDIRIREIQRSIVNGLNGEIHIRLLFFKLIDTDIAVVQLVTILTTPCDWWHLRAANHTGTDPIRLLES